MTCFPPKHFGFLARQTSVIIFLTSTLPIFETSLIMKHFLSQVSYNVAHNKDSFFVEGNHNTREPSLPHHQDSKSKGFSREYIFSQLCCLLFASKNNKKIVAALFIWAFSLLIRIFQGKLKNKRRLPYTH